MAPCYGGSMKGMNLKTLSRGVPGEIPLPQWMKGGRD